MPTNCLKRFPQIDFLLYQSPFLHVHIFQIEIHGGNLSEEIEYKGFKKAVLSSFVSSSLRLFDH